MRGGTDNDYDKSIDAFCGAIATYPPLSGIAPAAWMHYSTLLILVFLILFWRYREISLRIAPASVIAMSFALIAFGNFRSFNYPTNLGIVTILMGSFKFYGMMMLAVLMLREIWMTPAPWAQAWIADAKKILHK